MTSSENPNTEKLRKAIDERRTDLVKVALVEGADGGAVISDAVAVGFAGGVQTILAHNANAINSVRQADWRHALEMEWNTSFPAVRQAFTDTVNALVGVEGSPLQRPAKTSPLPVTRRGLTFG